MNKLNVIGSILGLALISPFTFAAGTTAGTPISNIAKVTYNSGASQLEAFSQPAELTVQELINATIVNQSGNLAVGAGENGTFTKFTIKNTGNGIEAFKIFPTNTSGINGNDKFDVTFQGIYPDDTGTSTAFTDNTTPPISIDGELTFWLKADTPLNLNTTDDADVIINAVPTTFLSVANLQQGSVVTGGDVNTEAVYGATNISANATYVISDLAINITKEITVINNGLGSNINKPVPGAEVTYKLTVKVEGTGTATNVVVTDPLPDSLFLKPGVNGVIATVTGATPVSTLYDANDNLVTVDLGDLTAGAEIFITFTTEIK